MANPFILKLRHGADLGEGDEARLEAITRSTRKVAARTDLIREGQVPSDVRLVLSGFAFRYKVLRNGRRQIMALLLPGDFCDLHVAILGAMDHGISTLTTCEMVEIPRATIEELTDRHPRINRALWWCTLVDEAILREWLVSMGQRPADQQAAHLFCELLVRLQSVGLATQDSYAFPLTQEEFGDALGLSVVHVNRVLQSLRDAGLIVLKSWQLTIPNVARLKEYARFNDNYLHLKRRASA